MVQKGSVGVTTTRAALLLRENKFKAMQRAKEREKREMAVVLGAKPYHPLIPAGRTLLKPKSRARAWLKLDSYQTALEP